MNIRWGAVLFVMMASLSAHAEESDRKNSCADDAEYAQRLRDDMKLVKARELFVRCSQRTCPSAVARECAIWLDEVTARLPTVVPSASDEAGNDLTSVRVLLDGTLLADEIKGVAFPMDPGRHTLRFEPSERAPVDVAFVVREGEHGRIVNATLRSAITPPSDRPQVQAPARTAGRGFPTSAYVTGSVGIVSLGIAGYAAISGVIDYEDLRNRCSPNCAHDDVTAVRTKMLVATVAGTVSVVAWSVTLAILLGRQKPSAAIAISPVLGSTYGLVGRIAY